MNGVAEATLIARLYDAVGNPDEWSSILDDVVSVYGGVGASIFSGDEVEIELNHTFLSGGIMKHIPAYVSRGFNQVDLQSYDCVRAIGKRQQFESEYELYPRAGNNGYQQPSKLPDLRAWLSTIGIKERFISMLGSSAGSWSFMVYHAATRNGDHVLSDSSVLLNHVSKIVDINRPFLLLNKRFNAVFDVINRLQLGVIVIDSHNRIVLSNAAADLVLSDADGISKKSNGELECSITLNVTDVASTDAVNNYRSGSQVFSIPRKSNKNDYLVQISNLSTKVLDHSSGHKLIVITDPERDDIVDLSGIAKIFSLSSAELMVAEGIVKGSSYKEIAVARDVSPETVKSQVSSIFSKTKVKNRAELIGVAHKCSIPVDDHGAQSI